MKIRKTHTEDDFDDLLKQNIDAPSSLFETKAQSFFDSLESGSELRGRNGQRVPGIFPALSQNTYTAIAAGMAIFITLLAVLTTGILKEEEDRQGLKTETSHTPVAHTEFIDQSAPRSTIPPLSEADAFELAMSDPEISELLYMNDILENSIALLDTSNLSALNAMVN